MKSLLGAEGLSLRFLIFSSSFLSLKISSSKNKSFCSKANLSEKEVHEMMKNNRSLSIIENSLSLANKHAENLKNKIPVQQLNDVKFIKHFRLDNKAKQMKKEIKKFRHRLRDYLNYLNSNLYDEYGNKRDLSKDEIIRNIDFEGIFKQIQDFYILKEKVCGIIDDFFIQDFLFFETEETIIRLINLLLICEKKYEKDFKIVSDKNMFYILKLCKDIILNPLETESKRLFAQRVLINLFSDNKDYFYDDTLVELNLKDGPTGKSDFDLIFFQGLNVRGGLISRLALAKVGE